MPELLEAPEIVAATRSPHGYLVSPLSDNISETEEGYLIIVGCPIARTGWQDYAVRDLPQERAIELGVDVSNPSATISLYRPASEVFAQEFLASLNGKPVVDGHPKDGEFVHKDNYRELAMGHIQNVRKGTEPLEDGEWPIIADLIISAEPLIGKVKNKTARDVSLGYDFSIEREGDRINQCSMIGNHNAIVPRGRAGDYVSIQDAAPETLEPITTPVEGIEAPAYPPIAIFTGLTKENPHVSVKNKLLRRLLGKEIIEMARAADADPEKVMEAAEALKEDPPPAEDKKAKDDVEVPGNTGANEFQSEDAGRKRMHDALDRMLDEESAVMDKRKGKDADIDELKELLDQYRTEEKTEPEHAEDAPEADPADLEAVLGEQAEDCPDCGEPMAADHVCDEEGEPGEELVESGEEELEDAVGDPDTTDPDDDEDHMPATDRAKAADAAKRTTKARAKDAKDGARAVLAMLKPIVARSNDSAIKKAWNRAADSVNKSSKPVAQGGGYGGFAASARARDTERIKTAKHSSARAADGSTDRDSALQQYYDTALKGGK